MPVSRVETGHNRGEATSKGKTIPDPHQIRKETDVAEHLTKATEYEETMRYCRKCNRMTVQRRLPGQAHPRCTEHDTAYMTKEQIRRDAAANKNWRQRKLFT
jgi:hypothetical protein